MANVEEGITFDLEKNAQAAQDTTTECILSIKIPVHVRNALPQQQLLISTLGNLEDLQTALRKSEQVQEVEALSGVPSVRVQFIGSIEDCAALLKSLLEVGIPISNFHRTQETLENIFLKLGYKQTS